MTDEWQTARKKPVRVQFRGPYHDTDTIKTIEGNFEVDEDYIDDHGGYVIIRGVEGEVYPCGYDIFRETYDVAYETRCDCGNPTIERTLAKGTPAEKRYCECGGRVRD